jgi:hypothetical protein
MMAAVRNFMAFAGTRQVALYRSFAQQTDRLTRRKPRGQEKYSLKEKPPVIEDIKSSIPLKIQAFEKNIIAETEKEVPDEPRLPEVETITIKGKTYIPQAVTAEQLEMKRLVHKKKGAVLILRKIRAIDTNNSIYDVLRDEQKEDVYNAINSPSFSKMAPQHILQALVYSQKTLLVKFFESKNLEQAILKVATYLKKLSPMEVASFAVFLSRARLLEEVN